MYEVKSCEPHLQTVQSLKNLQTFNLYLRTSFMCYETKLFCVFWFWFVNFGFKLNKIKVFFPPKLKVGLCYADTTIASGNKSNREKRRKFKADLDRQREREIIGRKLCLICIET